MAINERISNLIGALDSNPNSFADEIGVTSPVIYNIIRGRRSKPSYEVLQKILMAYTTLNANWLLRGEGDIWKEEEDKSYALDQGYSSIGKRIDYLANDLRQVLGVNTSLEELTELVQTILSENMKQKEKIRALYEKQDRILEVIKDRLGLNL